MYLSSKFFVIIGIFLLCACAAYPSFVDKFPFGEGAAAEDNWGIEWLTHRDSPYSDFEGISGRYVSIINLISEKVRLEGLGPCSEFEVDNYIFFYRESSGNVFIRIVPRFVSDPGANQGPFFDDDGREVNIAGVVPDMNRLGNCDVEYVFDLQTKRLREFDRL